MDKLLSDRLAQLGALIAVVTFGLSYLTINEVTVGLAVLGVIWFAVAALYAGRNVIRTWRSNESSVTEFALWFAFLFALIYSIAAVAFPGMDSSVQVHKFSWLQVNGLVGLGLALCFGSIWLAARHAAKFKQCPDCAEEVRKAARVCKFCAHEWSPAEEASETG